MLEYLQEANKLKKGYKNGIGFYFMVLWEQEKHF